MPRPVGYRVIEDRANLGIGADPLVEKRNQTLQSRLVDFVTLDHDSLQSCIFCACMTAD